MDDVYEQTLEVVLGEHRTRYVRVFDGVQVVLSGDVATGATTLSVQPDHPAIASGNKLLFGENIIVTASGACGAGATSLSVTAVLGPLRSKAIGRRIVNDLSGMTLKLRALNNRQDAAPLVTVSVTIADDNTDPAGSGKADIVVIAGLGAALAAETIEAGSYYWAVWDDSTNDEDPIAGGTLIVLAAGAPSA